MTEEKCNCCIFKTIFYYSRVFFQRLFNSCAGITAIQEKGVTSFSQINVMNVATLRVYVCAHSIAKPIPEDITISTIEHSKHSLNTMTCIRL